MSIYKSNKITIDVKHLRICLIVIMLSHWITEHKTKMTKKGCAEKEVLEKTNVEDRMSIWRRLPTVSKYYLRKRYVDLRFLYMFRKQLEKCEVNRTQGIIFNGLTEKNVRCKTAVRKISEKYASDFYCGSIIKKEQLFSLLGLLHVVFIGF